MPETGRKDEQMTTEIQLILDIVLNLAGLCISLFLTVSLLRVRHRQQEQTMFLRMCVACLVIALIMAVANISLFFPVPTDLLYFICQPLVKILTFLLVAQWLLFVDYTLHQSMDLIRRRYPIMRIPFFAAIIMELIYAIIALPQIVNDDLRIVMSVLTILEGAIMAIFSVASCIVLLRERRRTLVPRYIKLTPTIVCFAVVIVIIAGHFRQLSMLSFFCALGMAFAYYFMFRRFSFLDQTTGFYTEKYLPVFYKTLQKKQLQGGTVIRFQVPEEQSKKAAEILKNWEPEGKQIITKGNGEFLILSDPLKNVITNRLIAFIDGQLKEQGIQAKASYVTKTDEPADSFFKAALRDS